MGARLYGAVESVVGSVPPVVSVASGGGEVSEGASSVVVVGSSVVVVVSSGEVVETAGTVVAVPPLATEAPSPLTEVSTPSSAKVVSVVSAPESHDARSVTNNIATNVTHPQARRSRRECVADPMSCRLIGGPIFDDVVHPAVMPLRVLSLPAPFHAPRVSAKLKLVVPNFIRDAFTRGTNGSIPLNIRLLSRYSATRT